MSSNASIISRLIQPGGDLISDDETVSTGIEATTLTKSFNANEEAIVTLNSAIAITPSVFATIEQAPSDQVTKSNWDVDSTASNYELNDTSYDTTLERTVNDTFVLGTGSFDASDVGKRIVAGGGEAVLINTDGSFVERTTISATTYTSNEWKMYEIDVSAENGLSPSFISFVDSWNIAEAQYVHSFRVLSQENSPEDVHFKPDGTKMYVVGQQADQVHEYDLSTAWNISSASYVRSLAVGGQEKSPAGVFFKTDGTKMYICGSTGDGVDEYNLSTAWNISSASHVQFVSVSSQDGAPQGLHFKPDGTKMYIIGLFSSLVHEYDLSTAWDISSASYLHGFNVSTQASHRRSLFFKTDGTKMYVTGHTSDSVHEYDLSTAWDVSTSTYTRSVSVASENTYPKGLFFNPDGTKMYMTGQYDVYEYDTGSVNNYGVSGYTVAITNESGQINTAFWSDINSMTPDQSLSGSAEIYYAVSTDDKQTFKVVNSTLGERSIVRNNNGTWEYNSDSVYSQETWTVGTSNTAGETLIEAISFAVGNSNIMDSAQLSAAADDNHYVLSNTLDLAIIMKSDGTNVPSSDGVNINYIGNLTNRGCVIGVDFEYEQLDENNVSVTALNSGNYKFRIF